LLLFLALCHAGAVEILTNGTTSFNTSAPTSAQIPNWDAGWPVQGLTGWNYVGMTANNCTGVYLGNGWVITCAHVGAASFLLDGTTYAPVPGSAVGFTDSQSNTIDITLFQLESSPGLPPLPLAFSDPVPLSDSNPGDLVAMIGYLRSDGTLSWGLNTVTANNQPVTIGAPYLTNDFLTNYGAVTSTSGSNSATNDAFLIGGDSGGGDFIYDSAAGEWVLAGLNEGVDPSTNDSAFVQIDTYASQIDHVTGVPEPPSSVLAFLSLFLLFLPCLRPPARDLFRNRSFRSRSLPPA
jgi:hypothetical protein